VRKSRQRTIGGAVVAALGAYLAMIAGEADAADTPISQGRTATASSTESAAFPASAAVDGNPGTRWSSAFSDPQWLQVDLGASATITSVVLDWEAAYARNFTIKASTNGSSWTTLNTTTNGVFYYLGEGVRDDLIAQTQPLPLGLRIVAGNAKATGPNDNTISRWSCLHAGEVGSSPDFVTCPAGTMLESYLDFPHCWNGRDLDSADHKSHMSYPVGGACPASHPVVVPKLRQVMRYPVNGNPAGFRLASGPGYTMHGDFFNAWPVAEMARRVNDCIRPIIKCGTNGRP
jgi:hypothetical protein